MLTTGLLACSLIGLVAGQFPPEPKGVTILKSKFHENVTISYKEPGICETTPGVRSYSGYVHLPPGILDDGSGEVQDYPINTFFWFFEARKDPLNAPLSIWLNGGPGGSSIMGLLEENGPCLVGPDSKTTYLNPWSWNNEVNMLYLDQPTQVGFSYDIPTNGTMTLHEEGEDKYFAMIPENFTEVPEANFTSYPGTFSSQDTAKTANTTAFAAHALWHFAQNWFFEFPHYKPNDDRISLWTESYGGHYGPGFFQFFQQQNDRISSGNSTEEGAQYIHLDTLGIVNGALDLVIAGEAWISFPYNNTYGKQVFNESLYNELMHEWTREGGCKERTVACQGALKYRDSPNTGSQGSNWTEVCKSMYEDCVFPAVKFYNELDGGWFDIGHQSADPFPPPYMYGYLMQESVLEALGVPVNYSSSSHAVAENFERTFDMVHGGFLEAAGYLLDSGIKVHMMYGDRDYACNWVGGEASSLAIPYSHAAEFADAGYSPLITKGGFDGLTRQYGNFSFTRVFQAGHEVPSYQPEAAYEIFMRATFNRDIPTGLLPVTDDFATIGPKTVWHVKNTPPEKPEPRCHVLKPESCVPEVLEKVKAGKVVVKDWFVVDLIEDKDADAAAGKDWQDQQVFGEL
ncbi:uncharacterized protein JN550_011830 [Neoarthrinium moseri]|uniref:uncharacterized protein n=1 Tax=Neoarthrinium moseri TaxID=1658444 RepID=UPI001FDDCFAB|nr:uncharacterized protein JN550_011830 [Neoarthrinium moseri]KAI1859911.1 hypothetical protein JN550_011830 [Neoarthrinium moseri]